MRYNFGIVQLSGSPEKSGTSGMSAEKSWKPGGWESVCFPLVSPGVPTREGGIHMEEHGTSWIDKVFSYIIYSYNRH